MSHPSGAPARRAPRRNYSTLRADHFHFISIHFIRENEDEDEDFPLLRGTGKRLPAPSAPGPEAEPAPPALTGIIEPDLVRLPSEDRCCCCLCAPTAAVVVVIVGGRKFSIDCELLVRWPALWLSSSIFLMRALTLPTSGSGKQTLACVERAASLTSCC